MHSIDDANRQMQRARKLHSGGKLVEAKRAYEKILSRFDFDSITEEVGNRLREIDPVLKEEANRKIQKAKELFQKGKLVEAKVAYEDIRRLYDFNSIIEAANNGLHKISQILEPETLYNEAIRFYGKGDREKARAIFARIVRDYPSSGLAEDARSFLKSMDG